MRPFYAYRAGLPWCASWYLRCRLCMWLESIGPTPDRVEDAAIEHMVRCPSSEAERWAMPAHAQLPGGC